MTPYPFVSSAVETQARTGFSTSLEPNGKEAQ